jgi:divalent metal cation (Fe/Co/Zn/Cd) transporter
MTYTNDCNFFDMVFQTLRLLAGILLGHGADELSDAEIGEVVDAVEDSYRFARLKARKGETMYRG